jgi:hypothetical protein
MVRLMTSGIETSFSAVQIGRSGLFSPPQEFSNNRANGKTRQKIGVTNLINMSLVALDNNEIRVIQ